MSPTRGSKPAPLKLHTRTTIVASAVLVAVFAVMAYFSDLAVNTLSDQQQREQAELLATRVAISVEHHLKRERRKQGGSEEMAEEKLVPDWTDVSEEISDMIERNNSPLSQVRVFYKGEHNEWSQTISLPAGARPGSVEDEVTAALQLDSAEVTSLHTDGRTLVMQAMAPVISSLDGSAAQIGTVAILLRFDTAQSYGARLRSLVWPLMLLAIVAITLSTYLLFRQLVYRPIDNLLAGMSKAEAGDLSAEVAAESRDEIGLLTSRFNRMLGRIREMTHQLNQEQRQLEDRVKEATTEIAERTGQLEDANLQLFEMQRQLTQLERLAAAGQLAAQFAHEVGTPLNLISGHVQLLRARATDDRTIKRLDVIADQIQRITNIVRSMLDSTRRPSLQLRSTDLNSLLARILEASQPTLAARNVALSTEMASNLPLIEADLDQLQQVFINLINNSLDAMPGGGKLLVATRLEEEAAVIEMSDTGAGIAEDQLDLIFEPMFSNKEGRGTGLGLTIVKHIVSEHGGVVEVQSQPAVGTTFLIKLPVTNKSAALDLSASRTTQTSSGNADSTGAQDI
jgi:two-component system, NtrC family, sensor kinase